MHVFSKIHHTRMGNTVTFMFTRRGFRAITVTRMKAIFLKILTQHWLTAVNDILVCLVRFFH